MLKSKVFWIAAIIAVAIIFITSLNTGRVFQGKTDVLFVPKSEKAVRNIDQILANAEALPKSLSFYDKLLELNPDIEDPTSGQTEDNRKKAWDEKISAERLDGSGIVRFSALSEDQSQAEILSQKVAADTTAVMSRYYDTKNDLDIRLIDGPIVFAASENKTSTWAILSLLLGIAAGMIVYLFSGLAKVAAPKTVLAKPAIFGQGKQGFLWEKNPIEKKELAKETLEKVIASSEETPYFAVGKKAGAPENLPIAGSLNFGDGEKTAGPEAEAQESEKTHEATEEEVRARLNKLLGGGI